jgi:hypothetical protein
VKYVHIIDSGSSFPELRHSRIVLDRSPLPQYSMYLSRNSQLPLRFVRALSCGYVQMQRSIAFHVVTSEVLDDVRMLDLREDPALGGQLLFLFL